MARTCRNDGCEADARARSSYCSRDCRDEDSEQSLEDLLDPEAP